MPPQTVSSPYGPVSVALHWLIAALIVIQVCLGWSMNQWLPDHSPAQAVVRGAHISLGLTILVVVLIRIAVRLTHPAPPLPAEMPAWEKLAARASHLLFYLLMLALPLTGWAIVSLGTHPISVWGLPWPHLPGVHAVLGANPTKDQREQLAHLHVYVLIWIVAVNLALHVAAAIRHQFGPHPVIWRMTTGRPPPGKPFG
jgi:cytochrome b561